MAAQPSCTVTLVALLLIGQSLGGTARAADLRAPPPPVESVRVGEGWYLRVDATVSDYDRPRDADHPSELVRPTLDTAPAYGGGVGYRVNGWLRVDATLDQRVGARYGAASSGLAAEAGSRIERGDLDVLTGLVTVYADLGTWWGLTPYLGAGLGFADKGFTKASTRTTCFVDSCDGAAGTGPRDPVKRPNHAVTSLAWALTGGVYYQLGHGLSLDTGYRYVDLGRAKTGMDVNGTGTRLKDLAAHEVRVGLRYSFAGGPGPLASLSLPRWNRNPYE